MPVNTTVVHKSTVRPTSSSFLFTACIGMGLPVLAFIITYSSPESPRYYILKGWRPEAMVSLRILRGAYADVEDEMRDIEESIDVEQVEWKEFRKPELKRPLQVRCCRCMNVDATNST